MNIIKGCVSKNHENCMIFKKKIRASEVPKSMSHSSTWHLYLVTSDLIGEMTYSSSIPSKVTVGLEIVNREVPGAFVRVSVSSVAFITGTHLGIDVRLILPP